MTDKFICNNCGNCCRFEKEVQKFVNYGNFYKWGGSEFTPGLALLDFEVSRYNSAAEKLGISLKIEPEVMLIDIINKQNIIIHWKLAEKSCPFLKENKCLIYEFRSLICQMHPLDTTLKEYPLAENYKLDLEFIESPCPKQVFKKNQSVSMTYREFLKTIYDAYGDAFKARYILETIDIYYLQALDFLEGTGKVTWMYGPDPDEAFRISQNWPQKSISDFLKENNVYFDFEARAKKEVKKIIESLEH